MSPIELYVTVATNMIKLQLAVFQMMLSPMTAFDLNPVHKGNSEDRNGSTKWDARSSKWDAKSSKWDAKS